MSFHILKRFDISIMELSHYTHAGAVRVEFMWQEKKEGAGIMWMSEATKSPDSFPKYFDVKWVFVRSVDVCRQYESGVCSQIMLQQTLPALILFSTPIRFQNSSVGSYETVFLAVRLWPRRWLSVLAATDGAGHDYDWEGKKFFIIIVYSKTPKITFDFCPSVFTFFQNNSKLCQ